MKYFYRSFTMIVGVVFCAGMLRSQTEDRSQYNNYFNAAAAEFNVPADILRGVAFSTTRWSQMQWEEGDTVSACSKMPRLYGIMGLWDNYVFGHTLREAAALIGRDVSELKKDPYQNIRGGAALLRKLYDETPKPSYSAAGSLESWENAIARYTGIPQPELSHRHALNLYISLQSGYHRFGIDMEARPMNLAPIRKSVEALEAAATVPILKKTTGTPDYPLAKWVPGTPGCYYTSGNGKVLIVIHDMEGYYAANVSYFQKRTDASVHYCVNGLKDNASDSPAGEITQMVEEQYYAWHALCLNQWSLGIEHEGFVSNPAWFTDDMYRASAKLVQYMCDKYGIPKNRNHIVGHNEWQNPLWNAWIAANIPAITPTCNSHTDPGQYWNWSYYMSLVKQDSTPPVVSSVQVSKTIQAYDKVTITFNQIMDTASVRSNFSITPSVPGTMNWNSDNTIMTFLPTPFLPFSTTFTIAVDTGAHNDIGKGFDVNGDGINDRYTYTLTTGKLMPPTITLTQPKPNDTSFAITKQIILRFTDPMDTASVRAALSVTPGVSGVITWTKDLKTVYMTPSSPLSYSTQYTVRVERTAKSVYGAALDGNVDSVGGDPYAYTFRTAVNPTAVEKEDSRIPKDFTLEQNYPNPFNPSTHIQFSIPSTQYVRLTVADVLGREVAVLANDVLQPGTYAMNWNAGAFPSGVYFYTLKAGTFSQTKKLLLSK